MPPVSADRRIYERSPIVEAIIDLRCGNPSTLTFRDVARTAAEIAATGYSEAGESVQVVQKFAPDGGSQRTETKVGVALRSGDEKYVVQLQIDGFSCSRLHPYPQWETFRAEAQRLWAIYRAAARPESIQRVGIRYVNRLEIGSPTINDLRPFLSLHPVTPWSLTSPPSEFFLQIRQPQEGGSMLLVNESTLLHQATGQAAVLLDLDAFVAREIPVDENVIWNLVEDLHVKVEHAFEASITDRVRDLIR